MRREKMCVRFQVVVRGGGIGYDDDYTKML